MLLIGNFWLNPMIYHCSTEELVSKLKFFQHLTQLFGLDIIDEGMIGQMQKYSKAYEKQERRIAGRKVDCSACAGQLIL